MYQTLESIEWDASRPTVHARNLFHISAAMYDAWAAYSPDRPTLFLGKAHQGFSCPCEWEGPDPTANIDSLRRIAIHYAAYRVYLFRFNEYSAKGRYLDRVQEFFSGMGGNPGDASMDYSDGRPETMGNYIADCIIQFGLQDGAREEDSHENFYYQPVNLPLRPDLPGVQRLKDINHWQPVKISPYVASRNGDPTLHPFDAATLPVEDEFLTAEWGNVLPFALKKEDRSSFERNGQVHAVWLDPGPPPLLNFAKDSVASEQFKWGFELVALWSGFHDPSDGEMIDISPGVMGNYSGLPASHAGYPEFYDLERGGMKGKGWAKNPVTGKPYPPNKVPRGDFSRVIAEFWVDGVRTPGPPGHWIQFLHEVSDHPDLERKWGGKGAEMDLLEWDVKTHLALAGAMHDAAIAAWSVKNKYDYVRPITAIRYMAQKGQCSDPALPHFHAEGLPLIPGKIELVRSGDPLAGTGEEHLNKIKIRAWRGPDYVLDPFNETAGVDWILAENWWPYQRFSFTTPPFAGYVSGHSTFSVAGATVLELITGDKFFPGGLAEFTLKKNEFLIFEDGPSQDITLQWATYRDAADQTCVSRLFGGIHPPADDIMGRRMGEQVGRRAMEKVNALFGY